MPVYRTIRAGSRTASARGVTSGKTTRPCCGLQLRPVPLQSSPRFQVANQRLEYRPITFPSNRRIIGYAWLGQVAGVIVVPDFRSDRQSLVLRRPSVLSTVGTRLLTCSSGAVLAYLPDDEVSCRAATR